MNIYVKCVFLCSCILILILYRENLNKCYFNTFISFTMDSPRKQVRRYIGAYYWSGASRVTKPEDLNPHLLTHLYYAFLTVNYDGSLTIQHDDSGSVSDLAKLKLINPNLKLLFSLVNQNTSFSTVVANKDLRQKLIDNAFSLIVQYNYDGIDFDWEFPQEKDKENFISFLSEIHAEFKKHDYLLTAAVRAIPIYKNSGYNIPEMVKYLDIINIMTYDYYGAWSNTTGQNSPLYPSSLDSPYEKKYLNIEASINNWVEAGAPKDILALGLPFYGRTFTLKDPSNHGLHAPSSGGGSPLAPTYRQVLLNFQNFTTEWNSEQMCPYKYSGSTWLGYEDEQSVGIKVKYALDNDLHGVFVWQLGGDDVSGEMSNTKQPLLHKINSTLV